MLESTAGTKRVNPLDAAMSKAQVVRRKFKSSLPRKIEDRRLSAMAAMARTMELLDRFRNIMREEGLAADDVQAALIFCQPETPEKPVAEKFVLPAPQEIPAFAERVLALDRPVFLGVMFHQTDRDPNIKPEKRYTFFIFPFSSDTDTKMILLAYRGQEAKGGFHAVAD
jgi:hypothetical protein